MPSLQKIKSYEKEYIATLGRKQSEELLLNIREKVSKRMASLEKYSRTVYSPALQQVKDYYEEVNRSISTGVDDMKIASIKGEIYALQKFLNSKTSTLKGSRQLMREQDIRFFGKNEKTGRPLHRLTVSERTQLFSLYQEYMNQNPNALNIYTSNQIQQALGDLVLYERDKKRSIEFSKSSLDFLKTILETTYPEDGDGEYANVYSGNRDVDDEGIY